MRRRSEFLPQGDVAEIPLAYNARAYTCQTYLGIVPARRPSGGGVVFLHRGDVVITPRDEAEARQLREERVAEILAGSEGSEGQIYVRAEISKQITNVLSRTFQLDQSWGSIDK